MNKKYLPLLILALFLFVAINPEIIQVNNETDITDPERDFVLSAAPAVATSATVTNADDTDNLYARYKAYTLTANVTDADGNIDHMNVSLIINGGALQWSIKYDNTTDTFSEAEGATNIELVSASSYANTTATAIDLTISVKIEWIHSDIDNVILQTKVYDGTDTTTDNSSATFDVISSVAISSSTISDSRGNPSVSNLNITGTVYYCDSPTTIKPLSNEADVWITSTAGNVSDLTLSSGIFSNASVPASSAVGLNTYTIKVVPESGGVSGADQTNSTYTKTYISDKVKVSYLVATEHNVYQGDQIFVYFNLIREYDSSAITSGTVTLEGYTAQYFSGSQWFITVVKQSDIIVTFDSVTISGETYDITTVNMNSQSDETVWSGTRGGADSKDDPYTPTQNNLFIVGILSFGFVIIILVYYILKK